MSRKKKARALFVVAAGLMPLLLLLVFNLNPAFFAAASGWYGYNGLPVVPEATATAAASGYHGLSERNNRVASGCGDVIQYLEGVLNYQADGLSAPAPGFGFSHQPTMNNNHLNGTTSASDGNFDGVNGWNWHTGIFQLADMGSGELRLLGRGTASTKYVLSSGTYYGKFGVDSKIVPNTGTDEMVLYGTNGTVVTFYDFDSAHGAKMGALKSIVDASGNTLEVDYYTNAENANLENLVEKISVSGAYEWVYTYINNTGSVNHRRLSKVELKNGSTVLGRTEYTYYDSSSGAFAAGSGSNGDLMLITVTEWDSNGDAIVRNTHLRYAPSHKIEYIVGSQSYKELAESVADVLLAAEEDVAYFADYSIVCDSSGFVTLATVRGGGCSCSAGEGTYTYSYTHNGSWNSSSGFGIWRTSVTQTNPDGTVRIVDVNGAGSIINDILQTDSSYAAGDQRWITHYKFDSAGRITEIYHPSACPPSSYNATTHVVDPDNSNGLVDMFVYDSSGNLTDRKLKKGETAATHYWLEKVAYTSRTAGSHTIYVPSSRKVFPTDNTNGNGGVETTLAYTYYASSLAVQEKTVTHPAVPTSENGENATDTHKFYFNSAGQLQWEKDEEGSITYRTYHADLGVVTAEIVDLDTDGFSPSPPTGYTNSTGLSIKTERTYAADGKLVSTNGPYFLADGSGRIETHHYTHLSTGEKVVLTYPHVDAGGVVGPASIQAFNFDGKLITAAKGVPSDGDNNLADDWDDAQTTVQGAFAGDLYSRVENVYEEGHKSQTHEWTDAENSGATKHITYFGYDLMGRLVRVKDAEGTITRTYYRVNGRVWKREVGTNDYGAPDGLGEGSGTNNMTKVEEFFYDGEESSSSAVGDGNLTKIRRFVNGTASRDLTFTNDWRNRQTAADGEEAFYEKREYDNMNRVTVQFRYAISESSANLRSKAETKFDARGQVYQTIVHEVDPAAGTIDDALTTNNWYNGRGDVLKMKESSGLFTKNLYDGVRRLQKAYVSYDTDETAYGEADDVTGDTVVAQIQFDRDATGSVLLETGWERKSTGTSTGELTTTSAERFYAASWFDEIHRLIAVADYGTNGGATLTDYDPGTSGTQGYESGPPASSDTVLVTIYDYNEAGQVEDTTNPMGKVTRQEYDNLGRVIRIIKNYVDGTPGSGDDDQKQEIAYNKVSKVTSRKTWMTSASDVEETGYEYGVAKGSRPDSDFASNNLLKKMKYADPSSGSPSSSADDQESFAYNAQGELVYRKDQIGNVHEFDYDEIGRRTADKATTVITGVDGTIKRIQTAYDAIDRPTKVTSYDAATGGNVMNEVELVYNGFGQVEESRQEHDGAVDTDTLKVVYNYSEAEGGDPISRLNSIQYPDTNRLVYRHYNTGSSDHSKMDTILARVSGVSNSTTSSDPRIADYTYQGLGSVVSKKFQEPGGTGTSSDIWVDAIFDRFGRVEYLSAIGSSTINDWRYGYNRNSQILWREENQTSAKDELYTYDDLDRLDIFKRGDLNAGRTDITSPVRSQDWSLDLIGNWASLNTDGSGAVGRAHNRSNEIADIDTGYSGQDPTYDKNGNTTFIHRPASNARDFVYDAWNRLVEVKFGGITLSYYHYDGLNRRIRDTINGLDYYFSESWQVLAERDGPAGTDLTLKEYVYGPQYVDEILQRSDDVNGDGDTQDAGDNSYIYVQDANWNVHTLCDEGGAVVERYLYDPYGLPKVFTGSWGTRSSSAYGNQVLFTGRWWNVTSYTYDYRNREYSPYLGRFLQRDPIGIWEDEANFGNGYAYAGSDPTNLNDPSGLSIQPGLIADPREMLNRVTGIASMVQASKRIRHYYKVLWTLWSISTQFWAGLNTDGRNQFVFTCNCGWLDMGHFWMAALGGYSVGYVRTMMYAWRVEISQEIPLWMISRIRQKYSWLFWHRIHNPFGWADSAWTAEDWTSNKLGAFFGRELRRAKIRQPITIANAFASLLNACNAVPLNAETTPILEAEATAWSRIPARQDNGNFINSIIWNNIGGVLAIRPQVGNAYRKLCFEKEKESTMDDSDRDRGRIPRSWVGKW